MERRIRALKAIILVIIMVMELFGTDALRAVAEEMIPVTTDQIISQNSSYNYNIYQGFTLTIDGSATVTGKILGSGGIVENRGIVEKIDGLNDGTINNGEGATIKTIQNSSAKTVNNGTITTYDVNSYDTITNTGTIGTLALNSNALLNLNGGTITTLTSEAGTSPSIVLGGNANVTSITGAYNISGTGVMNVDGTLNLTGDYSELSGSIVVTDRTKITVPSDSRVKVKYGDKTYLLEEGNDQTLAELAGHTITITMQDDASQTIEEDTPLLSGKKYLSGETATVTYRAKKGYYFPENYSVSVSDTTAATAGVVRSEDAATITVKVTIKSDGNNIVVTLPAATEKETPAAPTGLRGGVGTISGVTNTMEYSKNPNAEKWNAIGGISDSGAGEINDLEAGDWYVRYKETATTNPSAAQTVKVKGIGKATVTVENVSYGKEPVPNAVSETNSGKEAKIEYKKASEEDTAYSETVPTAVGDYMVRATFSETDDYGEAVATASFSIKYLETPEPPYTLVGTKGENAYYTSEVTVTPADGYQISKTLDGTYQDTLVINETMAASDIYLVKKSTGEKTDAVVLQAINIDTADPILNVTNGETYKVKSKELEVTDANLSSVTINGVAQSVSGQSFKMNLKESSDAYEIIVKDKAGRSVEATIYVKRDAQTAPAGLTGGIEKVTGVTTAMEYAPNADAADWTAVTGITDGGTITLAKGTWYFRYKETDTKQASPAVKVMVEEKQKEPEKEPEKEKLTGSGKVAAVDVYYGKTPYVQISSETNDTGKAVIVYKEKSKPDTAYTSAVPVKVGTYTVRVTLPGNDTYKEVVMATEFKISYAPAPALAYTLEGTKGENGYYTSDVIIRPAQGYTIARTLNGTYGQMLQVGKTQQASQIYLKNAAGEMTDAISIEAIKIKQGTPTVNLEHGKTYYGDSQKLVIQDDYLSQVYVNGVFQNLNGTELVLQLGSNNGKKKYEITAVDVAGNKKTILVTVAAAWMKTGIIPEGILVNLETGNGYKLGTGNWKVAGDSTSYSGGTDFYVKKDGSYTFGKQ